MHKKQINEIMVKKTYRLTPKQNNYFMKKLGRKGIEQKIIVDLLRDNGWIK